MYLKVSFILLCTALNVFSHDLRYQKRQTQRSPNREIDSETSETAFSAPAAVQGSGKYFQDIYVAQHKPDELEFGHVYETPNDWEQRFEKIDIKNNTRKGKVRWGDKHGGYGEHYWDFNHAGHDSHDGEESINNEQYAAYEEESAPVPAYADKARGKREQISDDVEFISPKARSLVLSGITGKHGGNYKSEQDSERGKREQKKRAKPINSESLFYKPETGRIIDQKTGIIYELKPVE
ncbi:hypothetical protein WA026_001941 [Henosepilachna vigintioctopunctata]|uniref:Uncharacterized protein n=1 Tax=Henosepilachna vigintioctopunctata TaxID=420089 RepID=A0AAW1URD3_9CUCU